MNRPATGLRARLPDRFLDPALAAAFLVAMLVGRVGASDGLGGRAVPAAALSLAVAGALAARRTAPLASYVAGSAALAAESLLGLGSPVSPYANLIGLYSLGLHASRGRARLGPFVALATMAGYFARVDGARTYPAIPAGVLFVWLLGWALGYGTARRLEERDAARLRLRREAVAQERTRMARELHDLVGHTVTLMLVQAGAARRLLDHDPARAREVLAELEHTGRESLDELDLVLGLLRGGPDTPERAPDDPPEDPPDDPSDRPGLADLSRLTGRIGRAGVRVGVRVDPAVGALPHSIDVSAYRIVQEALTNTVRHARAGSAEVTVLVADDDALLRAGVALVLSTACRPSSCAAAWPRTWC
ncbi:histidine kinase [Kitasatospora sp. CM 4170]|uniref:histidine kinase n=1 Tax=Kitasatospora aburaviensis TaxID=67265 RepID=A0ABW1EVS5_9ACTN|nr:histidine kinase [Kitasatospora sp. CM 4170]WNM49493.1 histidine kinase [Kitasatospora sp. CM 4170]